MAKDNHTTATIAFDDRLWRAAEALRSNLNAEEYKRVVPPKTGLRRSS
jgi:hypothetical protein